MKWIKERDGKWKYVPDNYNAPEDKEFANRPRKKGAPMVITPVPWAAGEKHIYSGKSVDEQLNATDHFQSERKKWASGGRWKKWEEDRKKEAFKNKPAWRKKRMKEDPTLGLT